MQYRKVLQVFGVVMMLASVVGLGTGPFVAEPAYAKGNGGEGKGGGNGGGKGGEKGGDRGGKSAGKADHSAKGANAKQTRQAKRGKSNKDTRKGFKNIETKLSNLFGGNKKAKRHTAKTAKARKPDLSKEVRVKHGKIASELKGLNAAHASPTALQNASPNSMPGKLNTYREAILGYDAVSEELKDAQRTLDDLNALSPDDEQFLPTDEEAEQGITAQDKYDEAVADAEQAVKDAEEALGNTDPDAAQNALNDAQSEVDRLAGLSPDDEEFTPTEEEAADGITAQDKYDAAVTDAQDDLDVAEERVDTVVSDPQEALDSLTGGRDLSPEALAELHDLLGLDAPAEPEQEADASDAVDGASPSEG